MRPALITMAVPLLAGLTACSSEPDSVQVSQIGKNEAQALAEAESMLSEQRMTPATQPSGTGSDQDGIGEDAEPSSALNDEPKTKKAGPANGRTGP